MNTRATLEIPQSGEIQDICPEIDDVSIAAMGRVVDSRGVDPMVDNRPTLTIKKSLLDELDGPRKQERIMMKILRAAYGDTIDLNNTASISVGPPAELLSPFLHIDSWQYDGEYFLANIELREMIASTAFAVLNDAEKFTTIVGEDTSGRIPALIIGKAINIVRERKGLAKARRVFIAGSIGGGRVPYYQPSHDNDNALLITEYISSGSSIKRTGDALLKAGFMNVDIAAVDRNAMRDNIEPALHHYYMGDYRTYTNLATTHLYNMPYVYKGVYKENGDTYARRKNLGRNGNAVLAQSRRDIDHFAQELVDIWTIFQKNNVILE